MTGEIAFGTTPSKKKFAECLQSWIESFDVVYLTPCVARLPVAVDLTPPTQTGPCIRNWCISTACEFTILKKIDNIKFEIQISFFKINRHIEG